MYGPTVFFLFFFFLWRSHDDGGFLACAQFAANPSADGFIASLLSRSNHIIITIYVILHMKWHDICVIIPSLSFSYYFYKNFMCGRYSVMTRRKRDSNEIITTCQCVGTSAWYYIMRYTRVSRATKYNHCNGHHVMCE